MWHLLRRSGRLISRRRVSWSLGRQPAGTPPTFEQLEARLLLTAEIMAKDGVLHITGDDTPDLIQIVEDSAGLHVTLDKKVKTFDGIHTLVLDSGGGSDVIDLHLSDLPVGKPNKPGMWLRAAKIHTGLGDDQFNLNYNGDLARTLDMLLDLGGGGDSAMFLGGSISAASLLSVDLLGGEGGDRVGYTLFLDSPTPTRETANVEFKEADPLDEPARNPGRRYEMSVGPTAGQSDLVLRAVDTERLAIDLGAGDDTYNLISSSGVVPEIAIHDDDGNDALFAELASVLGDIILNADMGQGDDTVDVGIDNTAVNIPENPCALIEIDAGEGNDMLHFEAAGLILADVGEADWSFLGGDGDDVLDLRLVDSAAGDDVKWDWTTDGGGGNDRIKVHIDEISIGDRFLADWSLQGGEGDNHIDFVRCGMNVGADSIYSWNVAAGAGNDLFTVMLEDLAFGDRSQVNYIWDLGLGNDTASADITNIMLGMDTAFSWDTQMGGQKGEANAADDDAFTTVFDGLLMGDGSRFDWLLSTGGGDDTVVVGVTNPAPAEGGAEQESPSEVRTRASVSINTGDDDDTVDVDYEVPANSDFDLSTELGEGVDTIHVHSLMEEEGIFYFFSHTDSDAGVLISHRVEGGGGRCESSFSGGVANGSYQAAIETDAFGGKYLIQGVTHIAPPQDSGGGFLDSVRTTHWDGGEQAGSAFHDLYRVSAPAPPAGPVPIHYPNLAVSDELSVDGGTTQVQSHASAALSPRDPAVAGDLFDVSNKLDLGNVTGNFVERLRTAGGNVVAYFGDIIPDIPLPDIEGYSLHGLRLSTGDGDDYLEIAGDLIKSDGSESSAEADTGEGDDEVVIDLKGAFNGVRIDLLTGGGDDTVDVRIDNTGVNIPSTPCNLVDIDTGDGDDEVLIDIAGPLDENLIGLLTGGGDDMVAMRVSNTEPAEGGEGPENPEEPRRRAAVSINTGDGNDRVQAEFFEVFTDLAVEVDLGAGDDTLDLKSQSLEVPPLGITPLVSIMADGGDGRDVLRFDLLYAGDWCDLSLIARPGANVLPEVNDEVLVAFVAGDVQHPVVIGALWNGHDVPLKDGDQDRPPAELGLEYASRPGAIQASFSITGKDGADEVYVDATIPLGAGDSLDTRFDIYLWGGIDTLYVDQIVDNDTSDWSEGDPLPIFNARLTLDGGMGNDWLFADFLFGTVQGMFILDMFGGDGDDRLTLNFTAAQFAKLQALLHLDGGAGTDTCEAPETARVENCEDHPQA